MCDMRDKFDKKMTAIKGGGGGGGDMRDKWDKKMTAKGPHNPNQLVWEREKEREREREIPPSRSPSHPPTFTPSLLSRDQSLNWKEERERARDSSLGAIIHHGGCGETNPGVRVTKPGRQVTLPKGGDGEGEGGGGGARVFMEQLYSTRRGPGRWRTAARYAARE